VRARGVSAWLLVALSSLVTASAAQSDTTTFTYDALGRLVQVSTTAGTGTTSSYTYDAADNRQNVAVATGTNLTVNPTTLPNGTVGTAYSQTIAASGGTSPYTYQTTWGTLPAGLTLAISTGVLSGTPTTAATSNFTITATDSASHTGNRAYSLTIGSAVTVTLSPATLANGTVGTAYSQAITASGGTSPYTYQTTAGTLPGGMNLSSGGVLSGTPTTATTSNFTITATDSASHTGNRAYTMTINSSGGTCSGVSYAINDVSVTEGETLTFTVTKSGSTSISCSVNYATANGTATAGTHYVANSGTLTFTSTQTSAAINVSTYNLGRTVGTKTMYVNLSSPAPAGTITDSQGVGSIGPSGDPNGCPQC
jgi:YD repeat-containing protein